MTPQTMTQDITMSTDSSAVLDAVPTTDDITVTASGFTKLNLSDNILKAISEMGFSNPSSIQAEAIPQIMSGTDIIAQAPTGSGKTAAFAIPVLQKLDLSRENRNVQALILCPTRELAIQVHREFEKLSKYEENISVVSVYGGQQIEKQLTALRKHPQIVVATPGRLMDHLRRGSIKLDAVKMVVLDEADEMLDMGFRDDINTILEDTSSERQTVLFSATMAKDIIAITKKFQKSPIIVNVMDSLQSTPDIEQLYFEVTEKDKVELLTRLLDLHNIKLALVFCNTKSNVDRVVEILKTRGYFSDSLHGDMNQTQREKVMRGFRNGGIEILVATDVAGRGIDVKNVEAVFNYDLPRDDEDYVHRIGRTARAGESGTAFSFVTRNQVQSIRRIERANGVQIHKKEAPSYAELESARINTYETKIKNIINCDDLTEYVDKVNALVSDEISLVQIAATLLKLSMNKESKKINKNVVFETGSDDDSEGRGRRRGRSGGGSRGGYGNRNGGGSRGGYGRSEGGSDNRGGFGSRSRSESGSDNRGGFGSRSRNEGGQSFDRKPKQYGRNSEGSSFNDRNNDRRPRQSDVPSLDDMIKSVKTYSEPRPKKLDSDGSEKKYRKPFQAGGAKKKSFGKDFAGSKFKKSKGFSPAK